MSEEEDLYQLYPVASQFNMDPAAPEEQSSKSNSKGEDSDEEDLYGTYDHRSNTAQGDDVYGAYRMETRFEESHNPLRPDDDEVDEDDDDDNGEADSRGENKVSNPTEEQTGVEQGPPKGPHKDITFLESTYAILFTSSLNVLLLAIIPAVGNYYGGGPEWLSFCFSVLALAPLAERLSFATEQLCLHSNATVAGLLNVTFGNATELIVGIVALAHKMKGLVQLSLMGSVLSNSLLVLGSAFLAGGLQYKAQRFHMHFGHVNAVFMVLAAASLLLPTLGYTSGESSYLQEVGISRAISIVLFLAYGGLLYFQLKTHSRYYDMPEMKGSIRWTHTKAKLYAGMSQFLSAEHIQDQTGSSENRQSDTEPLLSEQQQPQQKADSDPEAQAGAKPGLAVTHPEHLDCGEDDLNNLTGNEKDENWSEVEEEEDQLGGRNAMIWLAILTLFIALISEILTATIEDASDDIGLSSNFLAAIILPILGNAAEHASALIFGYKGKPTLALAIAVGSSLQIALFVFPALILAAWMIGVDLDFYFGGFEASCMFVAMLLSTLCLRTGEATYLEGLLLVSGYAVIAIGFLARDEQSLSV